VALLCQEEKEGKGERSPRVEAVRVESWREQKAEVWRA
jgi:hypothetical protein